MQIKVVKVREDMSDFAKDFVARLLILNNEYLALSLMLANVERSINEKLKSKRP